MLVNKRLSAGWPGPGYGRNKKWRTSPWWGISGLFYSRG